ncbi:MAG: hypothetical protein WD058_09585 [Dehalococcoidia bacterium]
MQDAPFTVAVINSNPAVGPNRLMIAMASRADGLLVTDARVSARVYRLSEADGGAAEGAAPADIVAEEVASADFTARNIDLNDEHFEEGAAARIDAPPSPHAGAHRPVANDLPRSAPPRLPAHEGDITTVYTSMVEFDRAGMWGLALDVTTADGETHEGLRITFAVREESFEPAIGDPAPASMQATLADVGGDAEQISSAIEPNEAMLDETVAEILEAGRPMVIAFVTPAFCVTRFCGPILESVVTPAWRQYGERVEFVHIEPYVLDVLRARGERVPVPAVQEWDLRTEPFIFVVDASGTITAKLEGITDLPELVTEIEKVLG